MDTTKTREQSPEAKKQKLDKDADVDPPPPPPSVETIAIATTAASVPIEAILPDSLIKPIIYERCVIVTLGDKRRLSEFIREINKSLPLPTFLHLKRVRNGQVLLFPVAMLAGGGTDDDDGQLTSPEGEAFREQVKAVLLDREFPEPLLATCAQYSIEELAAVAPQLKCQYQEVVQRWPCKFHEDKALEKLWRNEHFNQRETLFHCRMMRLCFDLRQVVHTTACVALTFDPTRNEIVALGWRPQGDDDEHGLASVLPRGHAVMRAIDSVAVYQGGGAWKDVVADADRLQEGLKYAREQFNSFADLHLTATEELKYGTYLCTGFDMYLTDEPCLMCSMAMVHSRVRRIFFQRNNVANGALGGGNQLKLHGVQELNHHYQVFRVNGE